MTSDPVDLNERRELTSRKSVRLRHSLRELQADRESLRESQDELENLLVDTPSTAFADTAARAGYLLGLFAETAEAQHPRRQVLIDQVRTDLQRICDETDDKP
jgi:hypothetical protein